ncbi:MAG: response regulator [Treponema sp.]|nr:response regulator [Treponema sp.]
MAEESDNYTQKPAKILIIDEHEGTRALLKRRLSIYGHEVFPAENYKQAISTLASKSIDIIFLNMFIAGENSYDFLRKLKDDNNYRNIPIIMISSDDDTDLVVKCIEAGAEDYLVKPLNQTLLRARLANCVARKEAYDKEIAYLAKIEQGQKQIQAQEKMASLGVLVSSISQELKNPLNFVINFAQVSMEICNEVVTKIKEAKASVPPEFHEFLLTELNRFHANVDKIYEYGQTADKILRFMLDQSTTSGGKKHPSSINRIVTQTITLLTSSYKSSGITTIPKIDTQLDDTIPHIPVSIQSLSKAIYNLLDNAVDSVSAKFKDINDARIVIKTENTPDAIVISIRDNGLGISYEVKDKIFEPFFTTKQSGVKTGLGLSTAQEIVHEHNGSISFDSIEGEYAEFKITLRK